MGYEIKLVVGKSGYSGREHKRSDEAELDGDLAWFPYLKDENDDLIETGRTEIYFRVYGIIELCCPGHESNLLQLDWKNGEADSVVWYYYHTDGNTDVREDNYGDVAKPVPVADVIEALEKDLREEDYRRFRWALGFLREMDDDAEVMFYGH